MNNDLVKLCIDTYRGVVSSSYSKEQANETIRKAFIDILGTDKPDYRTFRKHKNEIFEIIEITLDQSISSGFANNNFFDQFVEYRDLNLGDTNTFYVEDKSLLTVSKYAGGHHDLIRQRLDGGSEFTVQTSAYGIKIYDYFVRLLAGRIDWVAFVNKVQASLDNFIAQAIYSSFMGSLSYLPAQFKSTGTFSKDALLTVCDHVQAANNNAEIMLVGTRTALSKMVGSFDSGWSDNMKDERNTLGYVRYYEGIKTLVLPQVHIANTFDFALDNDKVLVLPSNVKPIKIVREGQTIIDESTDGKKNKDGSIEYEVQFRLGISTIFNVLYGYTVVA